METSYKEKYERALAKAKEQYNYPCMRSCMGILEEIFPELVESKDEVTRKEIINYFRCQSEEEPTRKEIHNKWIAWLENIPVTIDHEKREGFHLGYKACLEKQGEQKPADTVEPKFHEGEWIACEELNTAKIVNINGDRYEVEFIDGNKGFPHIDYIDRLFHLWTIQDAKDGDVLYINNTVSESIMIYKSFNNGIIKKYASYNKFGFEGEHYLTLNDGYITPATKEQRDTLEKAITNAGYTFDFEKKELKKIEPKPEENKGNIGGISPNWIEDADMVDEIIVDIEVLKEQERTKDGKALYQKEIDWLIALKEKMQPQPKQEWSEEDKQHIRTIIHAIHGAGNITPIDGELAEDWLKSLRPQNRWKPSEEQIRLLREVQQALLGKDCHNRFVNFMYELIRLMEE